MSRRIDVYHHEGSDDGGAGLSTILLWGMIEKGRWGTVAGMILGPVASIAYIWFELNTDFFSRLFWTAVTLAPAFFLGAFIGMLVYLIFSRQNTSIESIRRKCETDPFFRERCARELVGVPRMAANPLNPEYSMTPEQRCNPDVVAEWRRMGKPIAKREWCDR